jgi:hypothetical protein
MTTRQSVVESNLSGASRRQKRRYDFEFVPSQDALNDTVHLPAAGEALHPENPNAAAVRCNGWFSASGRSLRGHATQDALRGLHGFKALT